MPRKFLILPAALFGLACAAEAAVVGIDQAGQQFSRKAITIKAGDTIRYQNGDDVIHNINVIDAADLIRDMGLQKPDAHIDVLFDKAGKFNVRCGIHPRMKMVVTAE
jgi:plastocyanin